MVGFDFSDDNGYVLCVIYDEGVAVWFGAKQVKRRRVGEIKYGESAVCGA